MTETVEDLKAEVERLRALFDKAVHELSAQGKCFIRTDEKIVSDLIETLNISAIEPSELGQFYKIHESDFCNIISRLTELRDRIKTNTVC